MSETYLNILAFFGLCVCILTNAADDFNTTSGQTLLIDKFLACDKVGNVLDVDNFEPLVYGPGIYGVRVRMKLVRPIKKVSKGVVTLTRCKNHFDTHTCEVTAVFSYPSPCIMLRQSHQIWSGLTEIAKPPFRCPFKEGTYALDNGYVNLRNIIPNLPDRKMYYWIFQADLIAGNNSICLIFSGYIEI